MPVTSVDINKQRMINEYKVYPEKYKYAGVLLKSRTTSTAAFSLLDEVQDKKAKKVISSVNDAIWGNLLTDRQIRHYMRKLNRLSRKILRQVKSQLK